jgi:hypothetical protein
VKYRLGMALLLLAAAGQAATPEHFASQVSVTRNGDRWTADFRLTGRSPAWMFTRSELTREGLRPWRAQSWRVETPGVRLERHGRHDVLVAGDGGAVPARVRIAFTPAAMDLDAGYDPALIFTEGSVALYTEAFVALPQPSVAAVDRLPRDLSGLALPRVDTRIGFRDAAGPVLLGGRRLNRALVRDDDGDGTYVLFGRIQPIFTEAMTAILDPQLPSWIRAALSRGVPDIFARYAAVLGPAPGPKPTIMVSWAGATPGMASMGGSALQGLITMAYEGAGVARETEVGRGYGLWFIAHEAAHFWLGNTVSYQYSRDAWITEGGADLLAFRTVAAIDPAYDWRGALNQSIRDCVTFSTGHGVATAEERNEQRAYYACGAVFGLVAEACSHRPFIQFVRKLVEDNRRDRVVSRADWLAALDQVSHDPSLSRDIGVLLDHGAADPTAAIAALFARAGVAFTRDAAGMPSVS